MSSIEQTCGICLCTSSNYNLDSPCSHSDLHTFHSDCIGQWLSTIYSKSLHLDPKCPTCRTVLTNSYIDESKIDYIKTRYNSDHVYVRTIHSIKWQRRLYPLDSIYVGYPFWLEPVIYLDLPIVGKKTLKIDKHQDISYLGAGVGSKIIAYVSPDTNQLLYVYNKSDCCLPRAADYSSSYPDKTVEFIWRDNRYTAYVQQKLDNRQQYQQMLSGFYNTNSYIDDSYTRQIIDEINTGSTELLNSLLERGLVPNSSEHYEYTILSKCIEKGLFDVAMRILRSNEYFPVTVDLIEAVENGTTELYTAIINHTHFCETRFSRRFIEYNSVVSVEVKNLYRNRFNYGV